MRRLSIERGTVRQLAERPSSNLGDLWVRDPTRAMRFDRFPHGLLSRRLGIGICAPVAVTHPPS